MKKLMMILVIIGIMIVGARLPHVYADGNGNGFADLPSDLPVLP